MRAYHMKSFIKYLWHLPLFAVSMCSPLTSPEAGESWTVYTGGFNHILSVDIQDEYVWCGTEGGVVRWNTSDSTYVLYTVEDGLVSERVYEVFVDSKNVKWFGTFYGLSRFDDHEWITFTKDSGLAGNDVSEIAEDGNGTIWVAGGHGLSRYDGHEWRAYTVEDVLPGSVTNVYSVAVDRNNIVWIGKNEGAVRFDGNTWTVFNKEDGLADNKVVTIGVDNDNAKWFCSSQNGITRYDGETCAVFTSSNGLPHANIQYLACDHDGLRWFTAYDYGICAFDGTIWQTVTESGSIIINSVQDMAVDENNIRWFGLYGGGLVRYDGSEWKRYWIDCLPTPGARDIVQDTNGALWFGTPYGILKYDSGTFESFTYANCDLPRYGCGGLGAGKDGILWISFGSKLFRISDGVWQTFKPPGEQAYIYDSTLAVDNEGVVWFATMEGESTKNLMSFDGEEWIEYYTSDSKPVIGIRQIAVDSDNNKWIATNNGLYKYDGKEIHHFTTADGLKSNVLRAVFTDSNNNLWCGYYDAGVSVYDGVTWTSYTTEHGLGHDCVYDITEDNEGSIWFATFDGLSKFDDTRWKTYTEENSGLYCNQVFVVFIDSDNVKWVGTVLGLCRFEDRPVYVDKAEITPNPILLKMNYPNPFNPITSIGFSLPCESRAILTVYDVTGAKAATLTDSVLPAGDHSVTWYADGFPSGVYFYRLKAGAFEGTGKMTLVK